MKKRIIALLMAAAITTGVGGFGTYAYFTSAAEVNSNVNIAMGTLDVNAQWGQEPGQNPIWAVKSAGDEANLEGAGDDLDFTNVKPGDVFYRDVTVSNDGTLAADTVIEAMDAFNTDGFEIDFQAIKMNEANAGWLEKTTDANGRERFEIRAMQPGEKYNVRVSMTVKEGLGNDWQATGGAVTANKFLHVSAHQIIN